MCLADAVWKLRKFTLTTLVWQKFRESNIFTKEITKFDLTKKIFSESKFL